MQGECPDSAMVVKTLIEPFGDDNAEADELCDDARPEVATDWFDCSLHSVSDLI
jgi:hypothetical protein